MSPQVSRTLLSIMAVLNLAVLWMVFPRPLISKSISPFTNPLETVPRASITIGITVPIMFLSFFHSQARPWYLCFFLFFLLLLCGQPGRKVLSFFFLLLLIITTSSHQAKIRGSVCISKSQRSLCVSLSRTNSGLSIYHFSNAQVKISCTIPIESPCPVLSNFHFFYASFLHSLIMQLIVSSLSPQNLHLLFCCILECLLECIVVYK